MEILIDVDDVLSDTFGGIELEVGAAADPSTEELAVMFPGVDLAPILTSPEFHRELSPILGASAGVNWLVAGGHGASYLSSRPPAMQDVTVEWLARWDFPLLKLRCVGRPAKKAVLASEAYDLLIDDQIRYLSAAMQAGKRPIAMSNPWNHAWKGERVQDWDQLKQLL